MATTPQQIEKMLRSRNLKATPNRVKLLREIASYDSAIPYAIIQDKLKSLDRVTLYRSMQALLEKGIIHKAFNKNNDIYYALCGDTCSAGVHNHNHVHFECTSCHQIRCEHLEEEIQIRLSNHQIQEVIINLTGTCSECL